MHGSGRTAAIAAVLGLQALQALAQTPLINQRYSWPYSGPYKVDTSDGPRGIMTGYNQCNSTTATQDSLCVNAVVNNITDFCFYAPPDPNSLIANVEGECVAWCTTSKYGTRVIPAGAVTGMQMVKTPGYLALALNINGPLVDVQASDAGGELDPHGADNRGNPIGSLMYSTAFSNSSNPSQIIEWHEFISGTQICLKACAGTASDRTNLCDNIYDTVGCNVNIPLNYNAIGTTFQYCLGDNQLPPASNVAAFSAGSTVFTPATSSCTTYASSAIFTAAVAVSSSASASSASSSASASSGASSAPSAAATSGPTSSSARATSTASGAAMAMPTAAPVAKGIAVAAAALAFAVAA